MGNSSELIDKIEGTIVDSMQEKSVAFSSRAKAYSNYCDKMVAEADIKEVDKLLDTARSPEITKKLEEVKKESIAKLNNIRESEKKLQERLELPIVINYSENQMNILLPLNAEEREKSGLWSRLYSSLNIVAGKPKESLSYCNLSVIRTSKRKRNRIKKEIKSLAEENDFKKANLSFRTEELNLLLNLSKIGSAETGERYYLPSAEPKEKAKAIYGIKNLTKRLGLTYYGAYNVMQRFLKEKDIKPKKSKSGRNSFKFTESELEAIVLDYESRKKTMAETVPEEKTYTIEDVKKELGISESSAKYRVIRYFEKHKIKQEKRGGYQLTENQFKKVIAKRTTTPANLYREDVMQGIKDGLKDEQIRGQIGRKYHIENMGTIQGAINLYRAKISKGQI